MTKNLLIRFFTLLLGVLVSVLAISLHQNTQANTNFYYSITDLGNLGGTIGGPQVDTSRLNEEEQVVGSSNIPSQSDFIRHAFLWQNGEMTDLGTLGGKSSRATSINNAGVIVGQSDIPTDYDGGARHAFIWSNGTMSQLGTLGGSFSFAHDINDAGKVVGNASTSDGSRAFLYSEGTMTNLGTLPDDNGSSALSINNAGTVVGVSFIGDLSQHAVKWQEGTITLLSDSGIASDINESGQIVGYTFSLNELQHTVHRAVLWQNGTMIELGTLGGNESSAGAINNAGKVVGQSTINETSNVRHPFVWHDGTMSDLNDLLPPNSGWTLSTATDINNNGQIVGTGRFNNQNKAFLLTPVLTTN